MHYNKIMIRILALLLLLIPSLAVAQTDGYSSSLPPDTGASSRPVFPFPTGSGSASRPAGSGDTDKVKTNYEVWRHPNGLEEYYMLLALATNDKRWCDRISLESQLRKVDARPGVQVIGWRSVCLIEVARATQNASLCRWVRGINAGALNGQEFNENYCLAMVQKPRGNRINFNENHWLQTNPYEPRLLNAQAILRNIGFQEADLLEVNRQGLYENVTKSTWSDFLMKKMLDPDAATYNLRDPAKFEILLKRSTYLPDFSSSSQPADRYLRYSGTLVKLPENCYENATSEFSCRMLECLNVRDLFACRAMADTQEIKNLKILFKSKCVQKEAQSNPDSAQFVCDKQVDEPFQKIFEGPPETFLPYLNR